MKRETRHSGETPAPRRDPSGGGASGGGASGGRPTRSPSTRWPRLPTWIALAPVLALVAACGPVVEEPFPITELDALEPAEPRYVIQPGDELEIRFFHTPELNLLVPVRPDGYVSVPFGDDVLAAGRTVSALDEDLTARFTGELRDPDVTVIVRTFAGRVVHVGGEVEAPGVLPLVGTMTVLEALFQAGGILETARLGEVVVLRRGPDRQYVPVPVDIESALNGSDTSQNIPLRPYDAIFVPRSPIANVNVWMDLYIRRNIPINFSVQPNFI